MNATGLKFLKNEAKKLATVAIGISKKVVTTCLRIQFNAAVFPFIFAYGGIVYVTKWFYNSDNENETTLQPSSEVVCRSAKRLRNTAMASMIAMNSSRCHNGKNISRDQNTCEHEKQLDIPDSNVEGFSMGQSGRFSTIASIKMNEFSGSDLLWDIPILSAKAKYFAQCVKEEKDDDMVEARKALEQHSLEIQIPKTGGDINDMKNKAETKHESLKSSPTKLVSTVTRNADNCNANDGVESDSFEEKYKERKEFCPNDASCRLSPRCKTNSLYNPLLKQDKIMHREISAVNKILRKIEIMGSRLLGELSNLNETLTEIICMKEKLVNLEFQVDEGKKLLKEVEWDRFIMKSKLSDLEKLITDEEKFLMDIICEKNEPTGKILN